jgi:hypothetical protein
MQSAASTPNEYFDSLPEDRKEGMNKLRKVILENLPKGFSEEMSYGMIGYVVPHSIYPAGYHCTPKLPLPFMGLASQKNFIAFYHMGLYADEKLMAGFWKNILNIPPLKEIWEKVVYGLKNQSRYPMN